GVDCAPHLDTHHRPVGGDLLPLLPHMRGGVEDATFIECPSPHSFLAGRGRKILVLAARCALDFVGAGTWLDEATLLPFKLTACTKSSGRIKRSMARSASIKSTPGFSRGGPTGRLGSRAKAAKNGRPSPRWPNSPLPWQQNTLRFRRSGPPIRGS